jgi:hypothetical protein
MTKVIDENYILIQGWMVNELKLKGNELLIYAIIYGFSQDGESKYKAGLQYLADWTNSTKQGCLNSIKKLIDKEYIIKEELELNNIKYCNYTANLKIIDTIKQSLIPIKKSLIPVKESLINNKIINNNINKINNNNKIKYPTLDEVKEYIKEKGYKVDAEIFFNYFQISNWVDSKGNKVKNWKQKLFTWNSYSNQQIQKIKKSYENYQQREYKDLNYLYANRKEQ